MSKSLSLLLHVLSALATQQVTLQRIPCGIYTLYNTQYTCIMPLPMESYSPYFEGIGIDRPCQTEFRPGDVPPVKRVTSLVFKDMAQVLKMDEAAVRDGRGALMKANKDKLCEWLETLTWLTQHYMEPLMSAACGVASEVEKLKSEKIADQKVIIDLQEKVIVKKDRQILRMQEAMKTGIQTCASTVESACSEAVKAGIMSLSSSMETKCSEAVSAKFKETVNSGIESYASIVESKCSEALSEKKITAAVKSAVQAEDRSRNVIIFGAEEGSDTQEKVSEIFSNVGEKPAIVSCSRLGASPKAGQHRPIKVVLRGADQVKQILYHAKNLKDIAACRTIFICPDRTIEERSEVRRKVEERKKQRTIAANSGGT